MSIDFAILGILSYNPSTGYDLKKIIQDSPFMYWSGNNNQIYKALVELLEDGLVTNEVQHQEGSPSKKIYTITEKGRAELKEWVQSAPEPPELKKTFLIQLAWADQLGPSELSALLSKYENEINLQIAFLQETKRRGGFSPARTSKEAYIWSSIHDNLVSFYQNDLIWIRQIREELGIRQEENGMKAQVIEKDNKKYVLYADGEAPVENAADALDLISACMGNDTHLLLLHAEALSDDFFKLRSGLAGEILQKFVNYQIKAALVITDPAMIKGKAKDLLAESNRGTAFRTFNSLAEAENWLVGE